MSVMKKEHQGGQEKFSKPYALAENILLFVQFYAGCVGMAAYRIGSIPWLSVTYALFTAVSLGFVLRKHLCTHCYYYGKWCHCGWGKLTEKMFEKGSGNRNLGDRLVNPIWGTLMGLPLIAMILAVLLEKTTLAGIAFWLGFYIVIAGINGFIHVHDCRRCKMRYICSGSAAKKDNSSPRPEGEG